MIAIRRLISWTERARANQLPPAIVGGVPVGWKPSLPTCPDCGYSAADAEAVLAHIWTHPSNDRRRRPRAAA